VEGEGFEPPRQLPQAHTIEKSSVVFPAGATAAAVLRHGAMFEQVRLATGHPLGLQAGSPFGATILKSVQPTATGKEAGQLTVIV